MKKPFKIIIFLTCALFVLVSCNVKSEDTLTQDTGKDSISNYLEQKQTEESTKVNDKKIDKQDNKTKVLSADIDDTDVDYDVYKKIDLSEFVDRKIKGLNEGLIERVDGGLSFKAPCKTTVKASIKIDRGPGLNENDINDNLAITTEIGPEYAKLYYADYGNDFFGKFHEVERACEYFNGSAGKGKAWFSNIGVSSIEGVYNWRVRNVSNNDTEYVGEFYTRDGEQTIVRVTIKDIYYKISKPTGTVTDWDLDKDFDVTNFYGNQAFAMRELEDGYTYIIKPKFTYTVNDEYDDRRTKYINFYYTSDSNTPENAKSIMNERESGITPRYNKIGIGMGKSDWKKKGANNFEDFIMSWDKDTHTVIVNGKNGDNIASIKIDYIKEYKYKNCVENETPGYQRYLAAVKQGEKEYNAYTDNQKKTDAAWNINSNSHNKKYGEIEDRVIRPAGAFEKKTLELDGHKVVYTTQLYNCKVIPNLEAIVEKATSESMSKFFSEFYQFVDNDIPDFFCQIRYPNFTTYSSYETINNYMSILYRDKPYKPSVTLNITIDLSSIKYKYYGSWEYGNDTTINANTPNHGISSIGFTSLGYEPIITDWWYKPIENIVSIEEAQVGDYIHFGKYWTEYAENSKLTYKNKSLRENLEWRVLDKVDDKMLITTRHVIDCLYSDIFRESNTWENSKVRVWLNNEFIDYAFDNDEKGRIINNEDMAFLLSYDDATKYFNSDHDRQCKATYFARSNNCLFSIKNGMCGCCDYWLKTPGYDFNNGYYRQMYVNAYGEINTTGEDTTNASYIGIRPAMWIKIN